MRGIADNARNLSDEHLDGIAATGGLVGIGFWETASGGPDAAAIARSIAYAVERVGPEHVALGSDWDGAVPVPFDAANVVRLTDALLDVGPGRGGDPGGDGRERPAAARRGAAGRLTGAASAVDASGVPILRSCPASSRCRLSVWNSHTRSGPPAA